MPINLLQNPATLACSIPFEALCYQGTGLALHFESVASE